MQLAISPQKFIPALQSVKTFVMQSNVKIMPPVDHSFAMNGVFYWLRKDAGFVFFM
tara:strand:- start:435 stop:602 length:168 start_codon:yes stop_codon:yes gene_type:complete